MQGVKIKDLTPTEHGGFLCFDLKDIFSAIGKAVISSSWRCHDVECVGENADRLYELSEKGKSVSGLELSEIVGGIFQTFDGRFEAFRDGQEEPWLVVSAVDSSWFEVCSLDASILEKIRSRFREVSQIPEAAA
jgi:hypothetical protein